jgi:acyl-phosphate glycerol 3-phosphate acyltransferase
MGSGNVGVTNVGLSVARWAGLLVFAAELAKGAAVVLIPRTLEAGELASYVAVVMAVVGTRWPVWLGFQGGRGNSVGFGALLLLSWQTFAIGLVAWMLARLVLRSSFWAARVCMIAWPGIFAVVVRSWLALIFGALLALIYFSTHEQGTDDHMIIKQRWPSILAFLFSPPRK